MGLFKLLCLPMKMMTWPMKAPFCMMMWPLKKAFHLFAVVLLLTKIVVMLFMAVMFVVFTVLPTLLVGFFWMMKKMKMHMRTHAPRRFKP